MDAETATVLRGRAKAALTRTKNFIDKDDQTFDKNDIRNKLEKLELTYTEFDKADAALPIESSEMEEFEKKILRNQSQATEYLRKFICKLTDSLNSNSMLNLHINGTNIDNQLKQFWELEEIPNVKDKI
ncbi:hypothetical protein TNCV_248531 [Trichonephila clavipes]|nr:hypothetical protein TNCV_248531 [Trichonephila clavipes]